MRTERQTQSAERQSQPAKRLRVAAVVLHYRAWPDVRSTIDALLAQTRPADEVLVVDHASGDGSAAKIRAAYPQLEVVELPDNRGPSAGMNRAMAEALSRDPDAVLSLTDDTELAPDALEELAARLERESDVAVVGPLVARRGRPELVFFAGGYLDARTWDFEFRGTPPDLSAWQGQPPRQVDFLGGAGVLVRASAARTAGPIPEHFYYMLED